MYLSYSGYKIAGRKQKKGCDLAYWHQYIAKTRVVQNKANTIFGSTMGRLFEEFYNEELWRHGAKTTEVLQGLIPRFFEETVVDARKKDSVTWLPEDQLTPEDITTEAIALVPNALKAIKLHKLVGPESKSEVDLTQHLCLGSRSRDDKTTVGGRVDFLVNRVPPHSDTVIVDGKSSKSGDRFMDRDQLLWYGMLYWTKFGVLPSKLGYLFWRLPPEKAVVWIEFSIDDIKLLLDILGRTVAKLEAQSEALGASTFMPEVRKHFKPQPTEDNCKFCKYGTEAHCPEGAPIKAASDLKALSKRKK